MKNMVKQLFCSQITSLMSVRVMNYGFCTQIASLMSVTPVRFSRRSVAPLFNTAFLKFSWNCTPKYLPFKSALFAPKRENIKKRLCDYSQRRFRRGPTLFRRTNPLLSQLPLTVEEPLLSTRFNKSLRGAFQASFLEPLSADDGSLY